MLLGEIIKNYRMEHDLSLQDFANIVNSSKGYIHMIEENLNPATQKPINPSIKTLKTFASAMNMDLEVLLKQLDTNQNIFLDEQEYASQFNAPNKVKIFGKIPAGIPLEMIENIIDTEEIPINMLKGGKKFFGLKVNGNSMYPEYFNNDTLILEKVDDIESGQDAVVTVGNSDGTFKRVFKNENGIILQPLNPEYQPMIFTNEQIEKLPIKILGRVVELRRKK